jgi:hypothetical protein
MVKTYEILKLLTEEEVERMLAAAYELRPAADSLCLTVNLGSDDDPCLVCPLGVALQKAYSPTPRAIAIALSVGDRRPYYPPETRQQLAKEFTNDVDTGRIKPEDLVEIVRLSREG